MCGSLNRLQLLDRLHQTAATLQGTHVVPGNSMQMRKLKSPWKSCRDKDLNCLVRMCGWGSSDFEDRVARYGGGLQQQTIHFLYTVLHAAVETKDRVQSHYYWIIFKPNSPQPIETCQFCGSYSFCGVTRLSIKICGSAALKPEQCVPVYRQSHFWIVKSKNSHWAAIRREKEGPNG